MENLENSVVDHGPWPLCEVVGANTKSKAIDNEWEDGERL